MGPYLPKIKHLHTLAYLAPSVGAQTMTTPTDAPDHNHSAVHAPQAPADAVEAVVPLMPVVLPVVGAVMMFLLAFIAVKMA